MAISDASFRAHAEYPGWTYVDCRPEAQIAASAHHRPQQVAA
jgi:hypothetical protein